DRFVLRFQKFECPDEQRNVMSIDWPVITQAELLENDTRDEQSFYALLNFMRKLRNGFARNGLDETPGLLMKMSERGAGDDSVQVICDRADVFRDRPFIVVEHNDEAFCVRFDVIKRFITDTARKSSVAWADDDVLVTAPQVTPDGHAECRGKRGSCVAGAIAIMFALGAQKKTIEPAELTHGTKSIEPAGKHFVDIALVANVHDETVTRGVEHTMQCNGQFHTTNV